MYPHLHIPVESAHYILIQTFSCTYLLYEVKIRMECIISSLNIVANGCIQITNTFGELKLAACEMSVFYVCTPGKRHCICKTLCIWQFWHDWRIYIYICPCIYQLVMYVRQAHLQCISPRCLPHLLVECSLKWLIGPNLWTAKTTVATAFISLWCSSILAVSWTRHYVSVSSFIIKTTSDDAVLVAASCYTYDSGIKPSGSWSHSCISQLHFWGQVKCHELPGVLPSQ